MRCPSCGTDNPDRAKFCVECGVALTRRCPNCGIETPPGAKFCAECGTSLTGRKTGKRGNGEIDKK